MLPERKELTLNPQELEKQTAERHDDDRRGYYFIIFLCIVYTGGGCFCLLFITAYDATQAFCDKIKLIFFTFLNLARSLSISTIKR
jgi:hypothetical protein